MTSWPSPRWFLERLFAVVSPAPTRSHPGGPAPAGVSSPRTLTPSVVSPVVTPPTARALAVGGQNSRHTTPAFFRNPDPFKDDCHYGSADLEQFPATAVELALAMDVLDMKDDGDREELWRVCQSVPRMTAVLRAARRVRASDAVLARVK